MKRLYNIASIITAVLFMLLFAQIFFTIESFLASLGLEASVEAKVLLKRAGVLMLGLSTLMLFVRKVKEPQLRINISLANCIIFLGMSILGTYELLLGNVSKGMLLPIIIEFVLFLLFSAVIAFERNTQMKE
jgi:hypothetical protein